MLNSTQSVRGNNYNPSFGEIKWSRFKFIPTTEQETRAAFRRVISALPREQKIDVERAMRNAKRRRKDLITVKLDPGTGIDNPDMIEFSKGKKKPFCIYGPLSDVSSFLEFLRTPKRMLEEDTVSRHPGADFYNY